MRVPSCWSQADLDQRLPHHAASENLSVTSSITYLANSSFSDSSSIEAKYISVPPEHRSYAGIDSRASQIPDTDTDDAADPWDSRGTNATSGGSRSVLRPKCSYPLTFQPAVGCVPSHQGCQPKCFCPPIYSGLRGTLAPLPRTKIFAHVLALETMWSSYDPLSATNHAAGNNQTAPDHNDG